MADSSSNDNSDLFGGITPAPDSNDPSSPWNYNWLDPYGNFVASLPDQMPGPLSLERINGPREFYTDPQAYFVARDSGNGMANENDTAPNWVTLAGGQDTISGGVGSNDLVGDASGDTPVPDQYGHPNPLSHVNQDSIDETIRQLDQNIKSIGAAATFAGEAARLTGALFPPAAGIAEPTGYVLGGIGGALANEYLSAYLAHALGNHFANQINAEIDRANYALGNQYMNDAGGLP